MPYDIGEMQAAIWRTEEALDQQREQLLSQSDPQLKEIARRGLSTLEDLLTLQTGMLEVLLRVHDEGADIPPECYVLNQPRPTRN